MDIITTSIYAMPLIIAVLIIRVAAIHKLPKKTFIILWGIVLCRLMIPFTLPSHISIFNLINHFLHPQEEIITVAISNADTTNSNYTELATYTYNSIIPALDNHDFMIKSIIWICGVIAFALIFIISHLIFRRKYRTALPCDSAYINNWLSQHKTKRKVLIKQLDCIPTPLTYGIFKPVILLPKSLDWENECQLDYILSHEFAHIKSFDTLWKLILAGAISVHWFNPLVWIMYIIANRDIELSCDEKVIITSEKNSKAEYALTLIGLEEKKVLINPLYNYFSRNCVEERVTAIMKMKKASIFAVITAFILVIGTASVFGTSEIAEKESLNVIYKNPGDNDITTVTLSVSESYNIEIPIDASGYICEPTYYTYDEYKAEAEIEIESLSKGVIDGRWTQEYADTWINYWNENLNKILNGEKVEKLSPVYYSDGTPVIDDLGFQIYAKASEITNEYGYQLSGIDTMTK